MESEETYVYNKYRGMNSRGKLQIQLFLSYLLKQQL